MFRFLLLTSLLATFACVKPKEGCTDTSASNYSAAADVDCCETEGVACCCTYPQLRMEIYADTFTKSLQKLQFDVNGHPFSLEKLSFYLSDVKLIDLDNNAFQTSDTIGIIPLNSGAVNPSFYLDNDYRVIPGAGSSFTGLASKTFKHFGQFKAVQFTIGLSEPLNTADARLRDPNHAIGLNIDSLWSPINGYVHYGVNVKKDTSVKVISKLQITGKEALKVVTLPYKNPITVKESFDVVVKLEVDYKKWFEGIDIKADDQIILEKLKQNVPLAFSIREY